MRLRVGEDLRISRYCKRREGYDLSLTTRELISLELLIIVLEVCGMANAEVGRCERRAGDRKKATGFWSRAV